MFVNVEPTTLDLAVPEELASLVADATRDLRIVVELTERALLTKPAELLRALDFMRRVADPGGSSRDRLGDLAGDVEEGDDVVLR